ncbi:MAG: CxxC-x17-CxxC domain-containing protein [Nanoarchaeota archaeon]
MADFRKNQGRTFGRDSRGPNRRDSGRSGGRDFDRPRRDGGLEMHEATCYKCGRQCEVPFKPMGSKPVYCSGCFKKEGDSGDSFSAPRESFSAPKGKDYSADLEQINKKLDKIMKALELD